MVNSTPRIARTGRRYSLILLLLILVTASIFASEQARFTEPPLAIDSFAQDAVRRMANLKMGDSGSRIVSPLLQPYIVIDTHTNRLYLRTTDRLLLSFLCSTGTGAELTDSLSGQFWRFDTPRGHFAVTAMASDPVWRKPDWAFIEDGEPVPTDAAARLDTNSLGDYSLAFGDGYYIHGTIYERLIGVAVTHGCIRLAASDLAELYAQVEIGTEVVIF
jgi:L,D-transpeptidase ErfK/SrfK